MSRWFRFYDGVLDDPKVQRLPDAIFKTWVNLLCFASRNDGKIIIQDVAFALRLTEEEAESRIKYLIDVRLLEEASDGLQPHNWDGRQFKSDDSSERVKKHRMKQAEAVTCNVSTPLQVTSPDTDTEQIQSRAEQSARAREPAAAVLDLWEVQRQCEQATGYTDLPGIAVIGKLIEKGFGLEDRILPILRETAASRKRQGQKPPDTWAYFTPAIQDGGRGVKPASVHRPCKFVPLGSPEWEALTKRKPEKLLRAMLTDHSGKQGVWEYAA